jgi:hypothetical protein
MVTTTGGDFAAYLAVKNVTGIAEERGFRLEWMSCDGERAISDSGLATSNPFRTERAARAYAKRRYGVDPVRVAPFSRGPTNICKGTRAKRSTWDR